MTPAQQQYVQRLSAMEAARVRADLIKRQEFDRANRFWAAWEELHPTKPAQDTTQIAQAAWSSSAYNRRERTVRLHDWSDRQSTLNQAVVSQEEVKQSICSQLSERAQVVCEILADGQEHSRDELLQRSQFGDIDFRKHISDMRKVIEDNHLPYDIPKNRSFEKGKYQLIHK